jgi:hypothetical protein
VGSSASSRSKSSSFGAREQRFEALRSIERRPVGLGSVRLLERREEVGLREAEPRLADGMKRRQLTAETLLQRVRRATSFDAL